MKSTHNHKCKPEDRTILFGKYAGTKYRDVPTSYLQWFVNNAYYQMVNRKAWAEFELERRKSIDGVKNNDN